MGAYDSNPYDPNPRQPPWNPSADEVDRVNDRLSGIAVSEPSDDSSSIYQVMRAVEDAESTIKQQVSFWYSILILKKVEVFEKILSLIEFFF